MYFLGRCCSLLSFTKHAPNPALLSSNPLPGINFINQKWHDVSQIGSDPNLVALTQYVSTKGEDLRILGQKYS